MKNIIAIITFIQFYLLICLSDFELKSIPLVLILLASFILNVKILRSSKEA